jgi:hypothetical protein
MIKLLTILAFIVYSAPCSNAQFNQIKHGDNIIFYDLVLRNNGLLYRSKLIEEPTVFKIYKYPYYKSPGDVLLGGRSVRLFVNTTTECYATKDNTIRCGLPLLNPSPVIRILDKHGVDQKPLYEFQAIKMRTTTTAIDCNTGSDFLSCTKKQLMPYQYTFILIRHEI